MADITFSGLASGMDTDGIVTKLMKIERQPLDRLEKVKTNEANRLKAYGQLNTLLQKLKDAAGTMNLTSGARTTKAESGNNGVFTASSNGGAVGSYNISVSQLAQVQKSVSGGVASTTASLFGNGTLTVGGQTLTIDDSNNSLQGIAQAINGVSDKSGVTATIINDGSGGGAAYRLVLTGKDASANFTVGSNLHDGSGAVIPFSVTNTQNAQQAKLNVDGIDVVSNSNMVTGVISGVTLNLTGVSQNTGTDAAPQYQKTSLNVTADTGALKEKVTKFVAAYNEVMDWINSAYDDEDDKTSSASSTSSTKDGDDDKKEENFSKLLRGDTTVNSIKRGLQSIFGSAVGDGSLKIMSQIGISTNREGGLTVDSAKLDSALNENFAGVAELLAGNGSTDGVMKKFNSYLLKTTSVSSGMYAEKQTRYKDKVKLLDKQIEQKTTAIEKREAQLYARFSAMEQIIGNMNSTSSYIMQLSASLMK
ncbi:MAG: flagellar filament capping protein FliD [Desulfobulbaceae bacterium]|jgi:flagellar hook-associated protein 2|nr:flagellar filament capping protein FliD [Desulfobulbaceae bacterium]